jgi:hypothetical protein
MSDIDPFFRSYQLNPKQHADKKFLALSRPLQGQADLEAIAWQLEMEPCKLADMLGAAQGE